MRKTLLATTAAAALVAGTVAVSAQTTQGDRAGGASGAPAPAEKIDRGGLRSQDRSTTGQGSGSQTDRGSSQGGASDRGSSQGGASERGQSGQTQNRDQAQPRSGQTQTPSGSQRESGQGQSGQNRTGTQPGQSQTGQGQSGQNRTGTQPGQSQTGQGQTGRTQTGETPTGSGSASLTTEQRTKIRESVLRGGSVNRVSSVNFNVSVGTVVPRSVHLVTVPETIIEIHPAWRGFLYFVVRDEIVIVEPGTLRIVAVIT